MTPTGFPSWANYFRFVLAREFVPAEDNHAPPIPSNWMERTGHALSRPLLNPIHFLLQNITNPLVIVALTITALAAVTIVFYSTQFAAVVYTVAPCLTHIQPWMIKGALFVGVELIIGMLGLRALGRVCNPQLRTAWNAHQITAIPIGSRLNNQ